MAQMTPQASGVLEKALTLSTQERGLLINRLIESLDEDPAEAGVEEAWAEEIKRRVEDVRSCKVEMISEEECGVALAGASCMAASKRYRVHALAWKDIDAVDAWY